jgi:hypothetical protein
MCVCVLDVVYKPRLSVGVSWGEGDKVKKELLRIYTHYV